MDATVAVPLTPKELDERRDALAATFINMRITKEKKKEAAAEWSKIVKAMEADAEQLAREIRERVKHQPSQMTVADELAKARAKKKEDSKK